MLAIACPGQGSQTPGFLTPWLDIPGLTDRLAGYCEVVGLDLVAHGTTSDADTIRDTAVAQPLIVAAGLLGLAALGPAGPGLLPAGTGVVSGHSVGEITAAAATGVLTETDALTFVRERGRGMAAASAVTPTGMSAVLGGDPDEVTAALDKHGLTAANVNGGGQVVAAGTLDQLAGFAADPPARTRVVPLQVAGAFHTRHMAPAVDALGTLAAGLSTGAPSVTLLSNADGAAVDDGAQVLARLVSQVSNPVRWDLCTQTLDALGVTALVELPPAGALAGLAKRALKGIEIVALKTPDDLDAATTLLSNHGGTR